MNFFEELYIESISHDEQLLHDNNSFKKAFSKYKESREKLESQLCGDSKKLFEELLEANDDLYYIIEEIERFKAGFRLGGQMVYNCFVD